MKNKPVIKVSHLTKVFKTKRKHGFFKDILRPDYVLTKAVDDLSFDVFTGESVAFLGPNGAGKTTTTKMLSGLIYPSAGTVNVLGFMPFDKKREFLSQIGLVMGNKSGLNWDLTTRQSYELYQRIYKIDPVVFQKKVNEMTTLLHTKDLMDIPIRKLSLGERMKQELIASFLHSPKVLFLDEPTIGLDITSKHLIRKFLRDIQSKYNVTLLLTSHDMDDVETVCDRVIVIDKGKKVYDDTLSNLSNTYKDKRYVNFVFRELPPMEYISSILEQYDASIITSQDEAYLVAVSNTDMAGVITAMTSEYNIVDIDIEKVPLEKMIEDIFVAG